MECDDFQICIKSNSHFEAQFSSLDDLESSALALQQISAFSSPQPFDLNLEFALVPGRLSLLSQSKKHRVRVGEVG